MDKVDKKRITLLSIICVLLFFMSGFREDHYLGRGFIYFEKPGQLFYQKRGDTLRFNIPPDVLSYKNTLNAILVKQRPFQYPYRGDTPYVYPYGRDTVYFFFIDKKTKQVTGPLLFSDMQSFLKQKNLEYLMDSLE